MSKKDLAKYVESIISVLGLTAESNGSIRWDEGTTALFVDQLQQVEATLYKKLFSELKASQFVPFDTTINRGVERYGYNMLTKVGAAKMIKYDTTELNDVTLKIEREFVKIEGLGLSYSYTIAEIWAAGFSGVPLPTEKAEMARMAVAEKIDSMATRGETSLGMYGLTNHPNVSLFTPATGDWLNADGSVDATGLEMIEDIKILINGVNRQSRKALKVNTLVLPDRLHQALSQTFLGTTGLNTITALSALREMFPGVTFDTWDELETADVAGTGNRIMAYHKNPTVLTFPVPILFEQLPPQAQMFKIVIPVHGRVGGLVVRYPMAIGAMDGC